MTVLRRSFLFSMLSVGLPVQAATSTPSVPPKGLVRVKDGRELLRDCVPWVPRGLSFFGRVIPAGWTSDEGTMAAREAYGPWVLDAVKFLGGDVVRLQVGMPFVDPASPQHVPSYLDEIKQAVRSARQQGMTVILSLQYEGRTNVKPVEFLPKQSALRSWRVLGPEFANDLGVVYELFNEPASPPKPGAQTWRSWAAGHQAIITELRKAGIANTIIVDGLNGAHTFAGMPALSDPLNQIVFGVHPYLHEDYDTPADWDVAFGNLARTRAVLVTEWSHDSKKCVLAGADEVQQLLDYLEQRRIGLIIYGADERMSNLMKRRGGDFELSTYRNRACGAAGSGPGEIVQHLFARLNRVNAASRPAAASVCTMR